MTAVIYARYSSHNQTEQVGDAVGVGCPADASGSQKKGKLISLKKTVTFILAVSIFMFAIFGSLSEQATTNATDPICTLWPIYIEKEKTLPTIWSALNFDCENILMLFDFRDSGEIFAYDILFSDGIGKMESEVLGGWEKNDSRYIIRLLGSERTMDAYMEEGDLCINLWDDNLYSRLSRFESFDWYKNLFRQ